MGLCLGRETRDESTHEVWTGLWITLGDERRSRQPGTITDIDPPDSGSDLDSAVDMLMSVIVLFWSPLCIPCG
jgi:hypothetical protein